MTRITAQNDLYHNGIFETAMEKQSGKGKMSNATFYPTNYQFIKVNSIFKKSNPLIISFLAKKKAAKAAKVHTNIIQKQ